MWPELFEDSNSVGSGVTRCNEVNEEIEKNELESDPIDCVICVMLVDQTHFSEENYVYTII